MGSDEGRSDQASRSLPDSAGVRQGHNAADADLRRQRESEVAALGGRPDTAHQNPRVRGLAISRAARYHGGEMRLERRDAEVASLQSQSLADMAAVNTPFTCRLRLIAARHDVIIDITRPIASVVRYLIRNWLSTIGSIDSGGLLIVDRRILMTVTWLFMVS